MREIFPALLKPLIDFVPLNTTVYRKLLAPRFRWYRELTSREQKTFWACFGSFGLDGMDVQIYSFVILTLISLRKLTPADAGLLATCTLLFSAVVGWLTGILADR